MNGLLTQKPGREPTVGETKLFLIEQRTGKSGKPWTKIKNATADQGGQPYRIVSVKPTGFEDDHGNISFNLEIEPQNGAQSTQAPAHRANGGGWGEDRSNRIERQHSQEMAIRYAALKGATEMDTAALRDLIDWFQRDVGRSPERTESNAERIKDKGEHFQEAPQPNEEEQF